MRNRQSSRVQTKEQGLEAQRSRQVSVNREGIQKKRSGEKAGEWKEAVESGEGWQWSMELTP